MSFLCSSPRMASGMQDKQYTPSLLSFFIYNPTFGPREGEVVSLSRFHSFFFLSDLEVHSVAIFWFFFSRKRRKFYFTTQVMWRKMKRSVMWVYVKLLSSLPGKKLSGELLKRSYVLGIFTSYVLYRNPAE